MLAALTLSFDGCHDNTEFRVGKYIPHFGTSALSIVGMTDAALSRTSADLVAEVQARLAKCDQGLNLDIHGQVTDRRTYKQRGNSHYSNVATLTAV